MSYFVYILYSESADRYYIGSTADIQQRLLKHNSGGNTSTKPFRPWKVVYTESYENRSAALKREIQIKRMKSRKFIEALVQGGDSDA